MKNIIDKIGIELTIISFIICLGIVLIYARVLLNFIDARKQKNKQKKEVKSIVDTLTMSLFFFACYLVLLFKIGYYNYSNIYLNIIATIVYVIGVIFNLLGRHYLGKNWGNQVVIYDDHTLVTNGVYKIVRHPLYASIIWMIYAIGIIYSNYLIIILNTLVFIPFMTYRSIQEERELDKTFKEYKDYKKRVGRFFPKIIK